MEIIKNFFLLIGMVIIIIVLLLMFLKRKKLKRNKSFRNYLLKVVVLTVLINFGTYSLLNYYIKEKNSENNQNETNSNLDQEKEDSPLYDKPQNSHKTENTKLEEKPKENMKNNKTNKTSKGFKIEVIDGVTYVDGYLIANKTYPLPSTYVPTNTFKPVTEQTTICEECINNEAYEAYKKMKTDSSNQGLTLWIASGYRSYNYQAGLYNNYVKRSGKEAADTFSARAGHSEHQTGYAFDLNSVSDEFANTKEGIWVNENCAKYGFIIRYPKNKDHITGYKYESWHLRYVGVDLALKLYNAGEWITLEEHFGITSKYSE